MMNSKQDIKSLSLLYDLFFSFIVLLTHFLWDRIVIFIWHYILKIFQKIGNYLTGKYCFVEKKIASTTLIFMYCDGFLMLKSTQTYIIH